MNADDYFAYVNAAQLVKTWPSFLPALSAPSVLDELWIQPVEFEQPDESVESCIAHTALWFERELLFSIPGLDAVSLALATHDGGTVIPIDVEVEVGKLIVRIHDVPIALRFRDDLLKPVRKVSGKKPGEPVGWEPDPTHKYVEISLAKVTLEINTDGDISLETNLDIDLPPAMIGDTGVVIEARKIGIYLGSASSPPGQPNGWRGLHIQKAGLYLPGELGATLGQLEITDTSISNGGFTGTFSSTWASPLSAELFGLRFSLKQVSIGFVQNALTASSILGSVKLPFFDAPVDMEIGLNLNGAFTAKLLGTNGLYTLEKPGILKLELESIGFEVKENLFTAKLGGKLTPLFGDLDWPSFQVKELTIDSEGNIHLEGGWLNLREQYSLDFYGFKLEITKLGFGKTEDGGKWIGFSGGIKLVDGLPAGASVEGLRITWYDDGRAPGITLNGVGVEFEVPDVLRFKGAVSYRELPGNVHRFDGDIKLQLISLDLEVDATLVIGSADDPQHGSYTFFAIYLGVELPAGIPLWSTGVALYGMAGLFALQMEPTKLLPEHEKDSWYENSDGSPGWYKQQPVGVTDLKGKWVNHPGSLGLGAGVTIGTLPDNGYTFSGKMLFAIVFPGPILLIEGKANILRERSKLEGGEPIFRALAVLDGRAGTFLVGVSAQFKYGDGGQLIDIGGSAEAFFSFTDASAWHLYLGQKEPRDKRIRAAFIYHILESSSYWMLDASKLQTGSWVGWQAHWDFGPVGITAEAWIDGNAVISWNPVYFHGDLWLHGKAGLKIFWFSFGLSLDARFAADVFDPFHLLAELSVGVDLPWFLPDFDISITLEWGPEPVPPPLPLPLKEVAIEHLKVSTNWPLPRDMLLLPNYDSNADGYLEELDEAVALALEKVAPPTDAPIVPLDCRPQLTFTRSVNDDAMVGVNIHPGDGVWEQIGDPDKKEGPVKVRYGLQEVKLTKWDAANGWTDVAWAPNPNNPNDPNYRTKLFGSWAPVPATPDNGGKAVAQAKLLLWSKTPFDYTRHSGRAWDDWFTERFTDYPCVPIPPDQELCYDFEHLQPGAVLTSPWPHPEESKLLFIWGATQAQTVIALGSPVERRTHAVCFLDEIAIRLPQPVKKVRIIVLARGKVQVTGYNAAGQAFGPVYSQVGDPNVVLSGTDITQVVVQGFAHTCIVAVCFTVGLDDAEITRRQEMAEHLIDEMARWSHEDDVLEPYTQYRLKIVTTLETGEFPDADFNRVRTQTEFAYFRTEGPPGLVNLSLPVAVGKEDEITLRDSKGQLIQVDGSLTKTPVLKSDLNSLTPYVRQTVPATVPPEGKPPLLPRPVYRTYDVGVEFNENYVDLMYRLERRDLGLYLYDSNNRPVRDAQGRLIVLSNRWGVTEDLTLTTSAKRWITTINNRTCVPLEDRPQDIPHDTTLTAEGQVLDPDTVYEARLIPLLFHEDFTEDLTDWKQVDEGNNEGPGHWKARGHKTLKGKKATNAGAVVSLDGAPDLSVLDSNFDVIILHADTARSSCRYRIVAFDNIAKTISVDGTPNLSGGSSAWKIPRLGAVVQTSNIWGGTPDGTDPVKPGTMLVHGSVDWTDYRLSVYLRSATVVAIDKVTATVSEGAIGVVFRYLDANNYYRFSMDRQRKYRRLVRVAMGTHTILAEDDFVYRQDQDYLITIEAVGSSLCVYQDGALVFGVTNDSMNHGGIALYCWGNTGARFSDVRVDDFRQTAPIVYRFQFTTSRFANFFHHLHSFQDETWVKELAAGQPPDADLAVLVAAAVPLPTAPAAGPPTAAPSEPEARAYETLAGHVLGPGATQTQPEIQITRIERGGTAVALLVQSPEPVDWNRTALEVRHANRQAQRPDLPGTVKLTDVTLGTSKPNDESVTMLPARPINVSRVQGTSKPNDESVTVLLREAIDLTGYRIEYHRLPGSLAEPTDDPTLFVDEFHGRSSGLLFQETFGPNALDHYTIINEGKDLGPPAWKVVGGHIEQTSDIYGGSVSGSAPYKPGTIALTGSPEWANVLIRATLRSEDNGAIGIVFRYQDDDNYYCFSMDRERKYRRLVRKGGGKALNLSAPSTPQEGQEVYQYKQILPFSKVNVLWEDDVPYNVGQSYHLVIEAYGDRLLGYLDNVLLFNVRDSGIQAGQVGLYCWANHGARFEALEVEALERDPILWQPSFADLSEVAIIDEAIAAKRSSQWRVQDGALIHAPDIHAQSGASALQPGTYALGGNINWRDVEISVRVRADDPAPIGVVFRYQDKDHYYRLSLGEHESGPRRHCYRRLLKKIRNRITVLWQDTSPYIPGQTYELTIRAVGKELRGFLDGVLMFTIQDDDLPYGQVGFYSCANTNASFERVLVADRTRQVGRWTIHDDGTVNVPSVWRLRRGVLLQTTDIDGGTTVGTDPTRAGTYAIGGSLTWTNYRLTVSMRSDDDGAIGVLFRYVDTHNYYQFSLDAQRNHWWLSRVTNGKVSTLQEKAGGYPVGESFTLTVDAIGSRLVGYIGDERLFEVHDDSHPSGQVGMYCRENNSARFERVEVRRPPLEACALFRDRFPSGSKSGWSKVDEGDEEGPSNWVIIEGALCQTSDIFSYPIDRDKLSMQGTQIIAGDPTWSDVIVSVRLCSRDDDAIGVLFRYQDANNYYRFSMDCAQGYRRVVKNVGGNFFRLWEDDVSYQVGRVYELVILMTGNVLRGYLDGVPLFVIEDEDLQTGQIGLYCWNNHAAQFSDVRVYPLDLAFNGWLLDEPFDALVVDRWTFVADGNRPRPPHWEVKDGELRQTSNYGVPAKPGTVEMLGTYALAGDAKWTDYRVSVRLRSDDDDAIGVMFRYQDADNYYRFSMDAERRYRRLVKKVKGNVSVLWEDDTQGYVLSRAYIVTIDCVGERLIGYLDAEQLFSVEDSDLAGGRIALYCWTNSGARFDEVRVAAPAWTPYYTFEREAKLPAGTRVRVYAGNRADAPIEEPDVVRRFVALLDERGQLRLPPTGVDLRLRASGASEGHARRFLPPSAYDSVNAARVLRKADGTAFFVFVPVASAVGSALTVGQYRFQLTYRRDNRVIDPGSQVFSQAGDRQEERATIDIPWNAQYPH